MRANSVEALAWCENESVHPSTNWAFKCLGAVSASWDVQSNVSDAWTSWRQSSQHPMTEPVPPGAPIYWALYSRSPTTGVYKNYGHVAVADWRAGFCWSIDLIRMGGIDLVRVSDISTKWGGAIVGWATDLPPAGGLPLSIPSPPSPPPPLSGDDMILKIYISSDAPTGADDTEINAQRWAWADFIGEFDTQSGVCRQIEWLTEAYKDQLLASGTYGLIPKECRNEQTGYYSMRLQGAMPEEISIGGPKNWGVTDFRAASDV